MSGNPPRDWGPLFAGVWRTADEALAAELTVRDLPPPAPDPTRAAWDFVLAHRDEAASSLRAYLHREDPDALSDLLLDLAERFAEYDPARGSPKTWIGWRARAMATRHHRQKRWDALPEVPADPVAEVYAELSGLLERADDEQTEAVASWLRGDSGQEIVASTGTSAYGRSLRLHSIRHSPPGRRYELAEASCR